MDELNTIIVVTHDLASSLLIADTIIMLGRDRDENGAIIPGAKVKYEIDLIERDLAWQPDIENHPNYLPTMQELREKFATL